MASLLSSSFSSNSPRVWQHATLSGNGWGKFGETCLEVSIYHCPLNEGVYCQQQKGSIGVQIVKKGGADLLGGIRRMCSIVIFNNWCFWYITRPEAFVGVVTQIMALVSWAQLFTGEVLEVFVDDHVVKLVDDLGSAIKGSSSTVVDGNWQLDFMGEFACRYGNSLKKVDWFVVRWEVIKVEITFLVLEQRWVKVVANCHGWDVNWIFLLN